MVNRMKKKYFNCCLCNLEKPERFKGVIIGSGHFTEFVCKPCSRKNYSIYGTFEDLKSSEPHETFERTTTRYRVKDWLKKIQGDITK
jgi:hypothetical protein